MFKKAVVLGLAQFLILGVAFAAPDRTGKTDIGLEVAGAMSTDADTNGGAYVGGNLSYGFSEWTALGVSFGGHAADIDDVTDSGVTILGPDVSEFSLFGDLIIRVPTGESPFNPYGVVGLGVIFWNIDDTTTNTGVSVATDVDTALGIKLGGGVDYFVNDHWIANFNGAYIFNNADTTLTASAGGVSIAATDKVDFDYWTIGGGLKYLF